MDRNQTFGCIAIAALIAAGPATAATVDGGAPVDLGGGPGSAPVTPTELVLGGRLIGPGSGGFDGDLSAQDRFGSAVAALGDVDGDGIDDLAVGAPCDDGGVPTSDVGAVWILLREADGSIRESHELSAGEGGWLPGLSDGDHFGAALAGLGDLDGDGVPDLAVGAPGDDDGGVNGQADIGAVWILFLTADAQVKASQKISQTSGGLGAGLSLGDGFGSALAAPGDLGGDGLPELVVGVPFDDAAGTDAGALMVLDLRADGTVDGVTRIDATDAALAGLDAGDWFGWSVAGIGDLDGDGDLDLAAGAIGDDDGGTADVSDRGAVWILFLDPLGDVETAAKLSETSGGAGLQLTNTDYFGSSLAWLGGKGDRLAVGARFDDDGGLNAGAVYLITVRPDGTAGGTTVTFSASEGDFPGTIGAVDNFGSALAAVGDVGGNAFGDLAIGAPGHESLGTPDNAGAVWELFLNQPDAVDIEDGPGTTTGAIVRFGTVGAAVGDGGGETLALGLQLTITGGPPGGVGVLVMGPPTDGIPVWGQTLIPAPDLVLGLVLDGVGGLDVPLQLPGGSIAPDGVGQVWFADDHAPGGFTASAALTLPTGWVVPGGGTGPSGSAHGTAP